MASQGYIHLGNKKGCRLQHLPRLLQYNGGALGDKQQQTNVFANQSNSPHHTNF